MENGASAVSKLGSILAKGIVPPSKVWFDALLARWKTVRERLGNEAASFFLLSENQVVPKLRNLANQLARTCQEDTTLFQVTVLSLLDPGMIETETAGDLRFHVSRTEVEALDYSPTKAEIQFTLSNLTHNLIKVTLLSLIVLERETVRLFRLPQVGAPIIPFPLFANLTQGDCHNLLAGTKVQFLLDHNDSDAFDLTVHGDEGFRYSVLIECKAVSLSTQSIYNLKTEPISVVYPIRTPRGLRRHKHESS